MVEVVQADRDAAAGHIKKMLTPKDGKPSEGVLRHVEEMRTGQADNVALIQLLAAHRLAHLTPNTDLSDEQRNAVIEECARIIDERAAMYRGKAEKCDITAPDTLTLRECLASNAEACEWDAAAIRNLKSQDEPR